MKMTTPSVKQLARYQFIKRLMDVIISLALLGLSLPLLVSIALWIKVESRGPVLFKQVRFGRSKTPFVCLKFRTMTVDAPANVATRDLKSAHTYITRSGKLLRRIGIDELPQLINVVKGEMSLIGPRPVVLTEVSLISERDKYSANDVTPGIGGWAQSNGRDTIDDAVKARLDGYYAQNLGIAIDVSCVWRTAVAIFTSRGFSDGGSVAMSGQHASELHTDRLSLKLKQAIHAYRRSSINNANNASMQEITG